MTRPYVRMALPGRFWIRVAKTPSCWLWTGAKMSNGYGVLCVDGHRTGAHQYSYRLAHGPILAGLVVRHTCDTPACVNPDHLLVGSQRDNLMDMVSRGRHVSPNRNATACKHGHPFDVKNTYVAKSGKRMCRECLRLRQIPKNAARSLARAARRAELALADCSVSPTPTTDE